MVPLNSAPWSRNDFGGSGSGVYPGASPTWQKGSVSVAIFRDTSSAISGGPIPFPPATAGGFYWSGSTWVANSGAPVFVPATFTEGAIEPGRWAAGVQRYVDLARRYRAELRQIA